MESFFGLFNRERVYRCDVYRTRQLAGTGLFDYTDRFYNRARRRGSAGRMSPLKYEDTVLTETAR